MKRLNGLRIGRALAMLAVCTTGLARAGDVTASADHQKHSAFTEFDAPLAGTTAGLGTYPLANNAEGSTVGYYIDTNSVLYGFLRRPDGKLIVLDAPGAGHVAGSYQGTDPNAINDFGVITGNVEDDKDVYHGFLLGPDGRYAEFEVECTAKQPSTACAGTQANQGTVAVSINLEGAVAGYYVDSSNTLHGFLRHPGGAIATFDPTGSVYTFPCEETCLNSAGQVTGFFADVHNVYHGFLRDSDGHITTIDGPEAGAVANAGTFAASITPEGEITGYTIDAGGAAHGFIRSREGNYSEFDAPAVLVGTGASTIPFSINVFGVVTGAIQDSTGLIHGFSRSPDGHFTEFDAPGAGMAAGQGTRPSTNNWSGQVAGWFVDGSGLGHGFLWQPDCEEF